MHWVEGKLYFATFTVIIAFRSSPRKMTSANKNFLSCIVQFYAISPIQFTSQGNSQGCSRQYKINPSKLLTCQHSRFFRPWTNPPITSFYRFFTTIPTTNARNDESLITTPTSPSSEESLPMSYKTA